MVAAREKRVAIVPLYPVMFACHPMTESETKEQAAAPVGEPAGPPDEATTEVDFSKLATPPVTKMVLTATNDAA